MEEVNVTVALATDGSGMTFNKSVEARKAFVKTTGAEAFMTSNPTLAIPLTEEEREVFCDKNIEQFNGQSCLVQPNVKADYIN